MAINDLMALERCKGERNAIPVANLVTDEERRSYRYLFNVEALLGTWRTTVVRDGLLGHPMIG